MFSKIKTELNFSLNLSIHQWVSLHPIQHGEGGAKSPLGILLEDMCPSLSCFHYNVNAHVDIKPSHVTLACDEIQNPAHKVISKHLSEFNPIQHGE